MALALQGSVWNGRASDHHGSRVFALLVLSITGCGEVEMKNMPKRIWGWVPYEGCGHGYFLDTDTVDRPISSGYIRADLVGLKCFYEDDLPSKFIAIYSDGSGCDIFYEVSDGFYSTPIGVENVQSDWFADAGYLWFVPLPDDFEVWEDQKENKSPKIQDKG